MRELVANTFLTLDGVMQAPGGPQEDPTGGFAQGGWSVNYWDDVMGGIMGQALATPFDLLLGRKTYEIFAAHWPHAEGARDERGDDAVVSQDPGARALNKARKYVASTTLRTVEWNNSSLLEGDVPTAVARLKKQPGPELQVHGSSSLLQTLIAHDLVDRFRLWTFPVLVGRGKRLFADGTFPTGLKLVDSITSTTGVIIATYTRGGEIRKGSFALESPSTTEIDRRRALVE